MRLHPEEKNIVIRDAIIAFLIFCIPLATGAYFIEKHFKTTHTKLISKEQQAQIVLGKNKSEIEEIRIIQSNQAEIDATWSLLNSWNQGSISQESATALTEAGFEPITSLTPGVDLMQETPSLGIPRRPQNQGIPRRTNRGMPGTQVEYTQVKGKSNQSEFLRVLSAINKIEKNEGLTQIQKLNLKLPPNTPPYQDEATYLNVELIMATPNAVQ